MTSSTPRIRRLIIGSSIALGFCGGGWLAFGLASMSPTNPNAHRFWGLLLLTVTLIAAMAQATGWILRAIGRLPAAPDTPDDLDDRVVQLAGRIATKINR